VKGFLFMDTPPMCLSFIRWEQTASSPTDDRADEVRFMTRLAGLSGTYSLDIRRLKGNLRSYKSIYDTIREVAAHHVSDWVKC